MRISDELHARARQAAGAGSLTGWVREAIAEKVARSEEPEVTREEFAALECRVAVLEGQPSPRPEA